MTKTRHDGDCTIYASLDNIGMPEAGICTCGYGHQKNRQDGHQDEMYSQELKKNWKNRAERNTRTHAHTMHKDANRPEFL